MSTRKEQSDSTKAAIMEAGRKLLAQCDVKRISISDIMKQCNLSNGLFYHYFDSKDAFITELISDEWPEKAQSLYDESLQPLERLRKYCLLCLPDMDPESFQCHRNVSMFKLTDAYIRERESRYADDYMFKHIMHYFEGCISKGVFSADVPAEFVSRLLSYVSHGISFHIALYKRQPDAQMVLSWYNQFFDSLEETKLRPYLLQNPVSSGS